MPKESYKPLPEAYGDLQVNCCRNPHCPSFGIIRNEGKGSEKILTRAGKPVKYTLSGSGKEASLMCHSCKKSFILKSNLGVNQELDRISLYSKYKSFVSCSNLGCENHEKPLDEFQECYYKFGKTDLKSKDFNVKFAKKHL